LTARPLFAAAVETVATAPGESIFASSASVGAASPLQLAAALKSLLLDPSHVRVVPLAGRTPGRCLKFVMLSVCCESHSPARNALRSAMFEMFQPAVTEGLLPTVIVT
jgi:hypothetical protein